MKDTRFNKAIGDIHNITMTSAEKQMVLERVVAAQTLGGGLKVKSPWSVMSFGSWINHHRWISVVAVLVIVIVAGNTAVLASYNALPGEVLYPIKVGIVEPIRVAFASSAVAKAEIQAELVQTRFQEIETLAARGTLTKAQEEQINKRIEKQTLDLAVNVTAVKEIAPQKAQDITLAIEAGTNTHTRILDVLASNRGQSRTKAVSVSASIPAENINETKKPDPVIAVARTIAPVPVPASASVPVPTSPVSMRVSVTSGISNASRVTPHPEYEQRKALIASLLSSTTLQFTAVTGDGALTGTSSSQVQTALLLEAQTALDQVKQYLEQADVYDHSGQIEQSYEALRDAERALEEASLLLKANVRFEVDVKI